MTVKIIYLFYKYIHNDFLFSNILWRGHWCKVSRIGSQDIVTDALSFDLSSWNDCNFLNFYTLSIPILQNIGSNILKGPSRMPVSVNNAAFSPLVRKNKLLEFRSCIWSEKMALPRWYHASIVPSHSERTENIQIGKASHYISCEFVCRIILK